MWPAGLGSGACGWHPVTWPAPQRAGASVDSAVRPVFLEGERLGFEGTIHRGALEGSLEEGSPEV